MDWFEKRYPTQADLEEVARRYGAVVLYGACAAPAALWDDVGLHSIFIPDYRGQLAKCWGISHELGHVVLGHGPEPHSNHHHELEADMWAARALIPAARIRAYRNATLSGFIKALLRHYAVEDDAVRMLAARIAHARLAALQDQEDTNEANEEAV
jgi:Zn-dependent peptidase ImmA (M78 family)